MLRSFANQQIKHNFNFIFFSFSFSFFQNFDFPGCLILIFWGIKEQKIAQNDKNCLSCLISQVPYIISLFVVHKCKMIISQGVFIFFKILILWVVRRVKGQKMAQIYFISQQPYIIWSWFMVHVCKRMVSPCFFFKDFLKIFFKIF